MIRCRLDFTVVALSIMHYLRPSLRWAKTKKMTFEKVATPYDHV